MIKKILLVLVLFIGGFSIFAATRPDDFRVERSTVFSATPEMIYAQIQDFHKWDAWSPWAKLDPNAKNSFEGAPQGKGAIFRWSGNYEVGEGSMTIVETRPNEFVKIQLDFTEPFSGTNTTEFLLKPQGDQTSVTWSMYGKRNFISKAMSIFMDCDQMIGGMYEKGFESMKKIVETKGL